MRGLPNLISGNVVPNFSQICLELVKSVRRGLHPKHVLLVHGWVAEMAIEEQ